MVLTLGSAPAAVADRGDTGTADHGRSAVDGAMPSQDEVDAAKADATRKARDVAEIKTRLLLANRRLEDAAVRAEQASEAYNGAMWQLERATAKLHQARREAARARAHVAEQRDEIGALVASSYQQANDLTGLNALMGADGPEGVLDQYVAFQSASTSLQADYERFAAADSLARVFARDAAQAAREQERVARQAEAARARAQAAAEAAQATADQIAAEKDTLIRELARAQDISVKLARTRQAALEELARKRAEERARQEALAAARAQARAERKAERAAQREADRKAAEAARARREAAARAAREKKDPAPPPAPSAPEPAPEPAPQPAAPQPAPQPAAAPAPSGGVDAVLAFARAQVGEPYQWAADGPDAWDCSGLTMRAWQQAGVYLPHYTQAQYDAGTPITADQLRPGDLVFWSTSSSPAGIHHVALYLGDGMIVHAPRTGRPVTVESMYYWVPPTHFVRV
ncbi:MAG: C40 family peptidase [Nocardioides sp.]